MIDFSKCNLPTDLYSEQQGYFKNESKHLFYALYLPKKKPNFGVVLCAPFGEEKVRTLRVFVSFARTLASLGVAALCFDYYGDGDSEGDFETASFENRPADIKTATAFLKDQCSLEKFGLLGLRWGSTLAALSAEQLNPDFLILWEPIVNCSKYFYDLLRINLASQMLIDGKVTVTRDELIAQMDEGNYISVEGYLIGSSFFHKARENGLVDKKFTYNGKSCIVQIAKNINRIRPELSNLKEQFPDCELFAVPKEFEWEKTDLWQPAPPQLFETTLSFMEKNGILRRNI